MCTAERTKKNCLIGLIYTSDGIRSGVGIGSARNVTIQCESKGGFGSGVGSSTESESEGSRRVSFSSDSASAAVASDPVRAR